MPGPIAQRRKLGPAPPPKPPPSFGAPTPVMGDPLSVPEADIGAQPAPYDDTGHDSEPLWLRLPDHLAPYFDLGFCHTDETCPYVILRARDDSMQGDTVEVGGPPGAFLELAEVIAALCRSVPCIAHRACGCGAERCEAG